MSDQQKMYLCIGAALAFCTLAFPTIVGILKYRSEGKGGAILVIRELEKIVTRNAVLFL
jgi:hypothetical protein